MANASLVRAGREKMLVPSLWWFEIRNMLIVAERRNRLIPAKTDAFLLSMQQLAIAIDQEPEERDIILLARRHGLTIYNASYLELAMRQAVPLATLDQKLASAAQVEGVPLIGR